MYRLPSSESSSITAGGTFHAVLTAGFFQIARGAGVAEPAAAEVNTDLNESVFVAHQVDIVVARSYGAEQAHSPLPVGFHVGFAPSVRVVEQFGLDTLLVGPADPERDHPRYVANDVAEPVLDRGARRV